MKHQCCLLRQGEINSLTPVVCGEKITYYCWWYLFVSQSDRKDLIFVCEKIHCHNASKVNQLAALRNATE